MMLTSDKTKPMDYKNLVLVVNSHHTSEDLWPAFLGEYYDHGWSEIFSKLYLLSSGQTISNKLLNKYPQVELIQYKSALPYNLQYLSCLKKIKEDFIVTANEDCIPSARPIAEEFKRVFNFLSGSNGTVDFVKLVKGEENIRRTNYNCIYEIDPLSKMFFTQQVSFWRKKSLISVYAMSPDSHIARKGGIQQEELGSEVCRTEGMKGYLYYNGESKRGLYHYDCSILPHICTAIVGGNWNTKEYEHEILRLAKKYKINLDIRGYYEDY